MHQNKRWGSITQRSSSHSTQGTINVLFQQARGSTYPWQTLKGSRAATTALISLAVTLRGKKNDERSYTYFAIARLVVEEEIYTTWATAHAVLLCSSRFITVLRIGQAKLKTNIPTQTLTNMWLCQEYSQRPGPSHHGYEKKAWKYGQKIANTLNSLSLQTALFFWGLFYLPSHA